MNIKEYEQFIRPFKRVLKQTLLEIDFFLEDVGSINVFSITSRIKNYNSASIKSKSSNIDISDLQDIAGIRIVVGTVEEVEVLTRFFTRKEASKDIKVEDIKNINKNDGYRARHIIISHEGNYLRSIYPTKIEIQLATIFQYTFNFISRAWFYKSTNSYSKEWNDKFRKIAKDLEKIDNQISKLYLEVIDASIGNSGNKITPFSYQKIVKIIFNEFVSLDDAVDSCRMLVDIGYKTNKDLKGFFDSKKINELRNEMLNLKSKVGKVYSNLASEMPKSQFWLMFGLRYPATKKIIDSLK